MLSAVAAAQLAVGPASAGTYQAALLKDIFPGADSSGPTSSADIDGTVAGVEAKRISLVAVICPGCGAVSVFQGKKLLERVNLAASTVQHRIIPIAAFGGARKGKVTVTVTSSGKPVLVDGLGISRV
jgi:hypothetical protein